MAKEPTFKETQASLADTRRRIDKLEDLLARVDAAAARVPAFIPVERINGEPIVGWRLWSLFPWETTGRAPTVRLGSYNGHFAWQPRRAVHATCNGIDKRDRKHHDAPQLGCHCGVWAFRSKELLAAQLELMRGWMADEINPDVEYAIGKASLWGRVLEFQDGYRAEHAYPYALTVLSREKSTARTVRDAYGIDVDWQPWEPRHLPEAEPEDDPEPTAVAVDPPKQETVNPLPALTPSRALLLVATGLEQQLRYLHHLGWWTEDDIYRPSEQGDVALSDLASNLVNEYRAGHWRRGLEPVRRILTELQEQGLMESGTLRKNDPRERWRPTAAGYTQLSKMRLTREQGQAVNFFANRPRRLFGWQIEEARPQWIAERKAAQAKGRHEYASWLREWRADSGNINRLPFTDAEVIAAVRRLSRTVEGATVPRILNALAPGKAPATEAATLTAQLARLRTDGRVSSHQHDQRLLHWTLPKEATQ